MRTNIDIDPEILRKAFASSGARTKREVVHRGLEALIRLGNQRKLLELRGIGWEGDLDAMRTDIDE